MNNPAIREEIEKLGADAEAVQHDHPRCRHVAPGPEPSANGSNPAAARTDSFPAKPRPEAYHGLAGDLVRRIEPESEADPVAILVQFQVAFGNAIGRTAHFMVEGTRHYLNLFATLVGQTSKARKGTSWGRVRPVFEQIDKEWSDGRISSGLSSGEGVIWAVRDPIVTRQPVKEKGRVVSYEDVESDPGVADKRLMVVEPEFASVLRRMTGQTGNSLSAILRQAWETGDIRTLVKNNPAKATGAHISLITHVTDDELRRYLSSTEAASGFGNRFMWFAVRRSKCLPEGGAIVDLAELVGRFSEAVSFAKSIETLRRDDEARGLWHSVYPALSEGSPGLVGALTGRAEAQVMRLACIYALLDCSYIIETEHLKAALALWDYAERSTKYIFGDATGDDVADEILAALKQRPQGMTRTDIRDHFSRHRGTRVSQGLLVLEKAFHAHCQKEPTGGRPCETWFAGPAPKAT